MVITPAASHASMSQSGEPTVREMSADTMKMPDPIIDPDTSMVASVRDRALTNPPDDAVASPVSGMLLIQFLRGGFAGWWGGQNLVSARASCQRTADATTERRVPGAGAERVPGAGKLSALGLPAP